jgi:membrane-bound metal-dependent hydrolase YbcI (DUF457 family)
VSNRKSPVLPGFFFSGGLLVSGFKGHLIGGALTGAAVFGGLAWGGIYAPDLPQLAVLGALVLLGSLFPDVDTDSRGQHVFYLTLAVLDFALIVQGYYKWAAVLGFAAMFPAIGPHRGWTHTWWAMLVVPLPLVLLPIWLYGASPRAMAPFYGAAVLGYFSHLMMDRKWK